MEATVTPPTDAAFGTSGGWGGGMGVTTHPWGNDARQGSLTLMTFLLPVQVTG